VDAHVHARVAVVVVRRRLPQRGRDGGAQQDAANGSLHVVLLVAARATRRAMRASCIPIVEKK
jgi:hypothetical protein